MGREYGHDAVVQRRAAARAVTEQADGPGRLFTRIEWLRTRSVLGRRLGLLSPLRYESGVPPGWIAAAHGRTAVVASHNRRPVCSYPSARPSAGSSGARSRPRETQRAEILLGHALAPRASFGRPPIPHANVPASGIWASGPAPGGGRTPPRSRRCACSTGRARLPPHARRGGEGHRAEHRDPKLRTEALVVAEIDLVGEPPSATCARRSMSRSGAARSRRCVAWDTGSPSTDLW